LVVNANTVARAYRELEQAGTIATSPGRGSFIAESSARPSADRYTKLEPLLTRLVETARKLGYDAEELVTLVEQKARVTPVTPDARRR
jgi:GntR family transcriptional regulator